MPLKLQEQPSTLLHAKMALAGSSYFFGIGNTMTMQRTPILPNAAMHILVFLSFMNIAHGEEPTPGDEILGQGDFHYRVVKNWAEGALKGITLGNGHGLAFDAA